MTPLIDRKAVLRRARNDYRWYAERFLKIKDKDGNVVPFKFNGTQDWVQQHVEAIEAAGRPVRIIVLKIRQPGISTWSQGYVSHKVFTRPGKHGMCILHKKDEAADIFRKAEFMWEHLPPWLRPPKSSKASGRRLILGEPFNGMLFAETAENRSAGRSGTWQFVHISELPLWPDADDTIPGLLNSVPKKPGTAVIIECTAKGMGNRFHRMWKDASQNRSGHWWDKVDITPGPNGFVPIFLPLTLHGEYEKPVAPGQTFPRQWRRFAKDHGMSLEQLNWYLDKIEEIGEEQTHQDYPLTPDSAFLTSGRPFFRRKALVHYQTQIKEPERRGNFEVADGIAKVVEDEDGELWIWEKPKKGARYVIGADVSTGRAEDFSTAHVLEGRRVVASYRGKCDPDEFAVLLWRLARAYNNALLAPEINAVGYAVILKLVKDLGYTNVYSFVDEAVVAGTFSKEYGWKTTTKTRPMMLEKLAELTRTNQLELHCERTIAEMHTFIFADEIGKKAEAQPGCHDDCVMSLAIAVAVSEQRGASTAPQKSTAFRPLISVAAGY